MPRQDQDQAAGHEVRRDACGRSFVERRGRDEVRLLFLERSLRNDDQGIRRVALAAHRIEEAISAARARRDCGITKFATGAAGITIRFSHSSPRGSWCVKPNGGKSGPQQSPCRRSATASPCFCERLTSAIRRPKSPTTKHAVCSATKRRDSITTKHVTDCHLRESTNVDNFGQ